MTHLMSNLPCIGEHFARRRQTEGQGDDESADRSATKHESELKKHLAFHAMCFALIALSESYANMQIIARRHFFCK